MAAALALAPASPVVASKSAAVSKPAASEPHWARDFIARARQEIAAAAPTKLDSYAGAGAATFVQYAEAGGVGAALGALHAKHGLDRARGPIDGWISAAGAVASVALSGVAPEFAVHARNVGAEAFAVLAFRKTYELTAGESLPGAVSGGVRRITTSPGRGLGVTKPDPIEEAIRGIEGLE